MTHPEHRAACRDKCRGAKVEFLRSQQCTHDYIVPGLKAAISPHHDATAQIIEHERLVRISNAYFPRAAGVLH